MILLSNIKSYWDLMAQRIEGIDYVFLFTKEQDLLKKIKGIAINKIAVIVLVPSYDSIAPDADNIHEGATHLLYVTKRVNRKDDDEIAVLSAMDDCQRLLIGIRTLMSYDRRNCNSIMRHVDFNQIHTDPEYDYDGLYGWSMSYRMDDQNFLYNPDEFEQDDTVLVVDDSIVTLPIYRFAFVSPYSYCGSAPKGSKDDEAVWKIARVEDIQGAADIKEARNVAWDDWQTVNYN